MTVFSAETDGYKKACELIKALKVVGIEACLAPGCVSISCQPDQVLLVQKVCKEQNALFRVGFIGHSQNFLLKSTDGELLKETQGNAQAVINEWKE